MNHSKMPTAYGSRPNGVNGLNYLFRGGIQATPAHLPTEPMSLGSPPTSPNATHVHGAATGTQYLPGFLMGDAAPAIQNPAFSPSSTYPNSRPLQLPSAPVSPPLGTPKQNQDRLYRRINSPPTQSLWSMNQSNVVSRSNPVSGSWDASSPVVGVQHSNPLNRSLNMGCHLHSPLVTPKTPMQMASGIRPLAGVMSPNTCGTLGTENLISVLNTPKSSNPDRSMESCWVTVFGYPASRASYILSQFAQFGTIEKHVITNDGNWMHIKYQNKLQARCALSRNGRVFGDNIMVGVMPCSDEDVLNGRFIGLQVSDFAADRENSPTQFPLPATNSRPRATGTPLRELSDTPRTGLHNQKLLSQSFASPPERPVGAGPGTCGVARHSSMRSLTGDGRPNYLSRTASVRQAKETGLLSKALGYMFGWS